MDEMSYATKRKMRIIIRKLGSDWQLEYPGKSVDAVYNVVIGDTRKNLFCKISPEVKKQLDEMVRYHDVKMSKMVEKLVQEEYDKFVSVRDSRVDDVASHFAAAG